MWDRLKQARKRRKYVLANQRPLHFKRTPVDLTVISPHLDSRTSVAARVVLNDIHDRGLLAFTASPLIPGQELEITILEPSVMTVRGRTATCQPVHQDSRIISQESFRFRVSIDFEFQTQEEKEQMATYCVKVQKEFLKI